LTPIAHEDVDGAQLGQTLLDHALHGRGIGDVAEGGDHPHARLAALLGHGFQLVAVRPRVDDEAGAFRGEGQRDGAADVAAGPRDEGRSALEPHVEMREGST
jgi:hypothetical protein